jgi:hypothetical protein
MSPVKGSITITAPLSIVLAALSAILLYIHVNRQHQPGSPCYNRCQLPQEALRWSF